MAEKSSTQKQDVVTVNIEPFLLPGSIILASIILGASLLLGFNNLAYKGANVAGTGTTVPTDNTGTDTAGDTAADPQFATVSIDDDAIKGDKNSAKVAIVEFSDYECPFCQRHFQQTYPQIVNDYLNTGKAILVFRDYPLSFHDPAATREALGAECVKDLGGDGKYYEYHDYVFKNTPSNGTGIDQTKISEFVGSIGIDRKKFDECVKSEKFKSEIEKDMADATAAGISGTPGFIVGVLSSDGTVKDGEVISGAQPYSVFKNAIENQLSK